MQYVFRMVVNGKVCIFKEGQVVKSNFMNGYRCYGKVNGREFTATFEASDSVEAAKICAELGADDFERLLPRNYQVVIEIESGSMTYKYGANCMHEAKEFGMRYVAGIDERIKVENYKIEEI